jgi:hypothetical protein
VKKSLVVLICCPYTGELLNRQCDEGIVFFEGFPNCFQFSICLPFFPPAFFRIQPHESFRGHYRVTLEHVGILDSRRRFNCRDHVIHAQETSFSIFQLNFDNRCFKLGFAEGRDLDEHFAVDRMVQKPFCLLAIRPYEGTGGGRKGYADCSGENNEQHPHDAAFHVAQADP